MPYQATVIPVMIASPSDVHEYRSIARDIMHEWNYIHSNSTNMVLMPVGWETHSSPELGSTAQELINDRVLEDCDLLLGVFWTRLGTPTGRAASGTVEEVERHLSSGKPAMIYFSTAPASLETVDHEQYAALQRFRKWCEGQGIIEIFSNAVDFNNKFRRHLQVTLLKSPYLKSIIEQGSGGGGADTSASRREQTPQDPLREIMSSLSEEAMTLIYEASADKNGSVMNLSTISGKIIQTNGKTFNTQGDRRSAARFEYAIDQLVSLDFLVKRGPKGEVLQVTEPGYQFAEFLRGIRGQH